MTPSDIDILQNMDSRMTPSDNSTAMTLYSPARATLSRAVAVLNSVLAITGQWIKQARGWC